MINIMQTDVQAGARRQTYSYQYQRMKLAMALYDVEVAHVRLTSLEPGDPQYNNRLEHLKAALEEYWNVDEQIDSYIQRARGN